MGLAAVTAIFLVPGIRFWWRTRAGDWSDPSFAAVAAFSIILPLYAIDNILNAMINPVITVCMGAVTAAALRRVTPAPVDAEVLSPQLHLRKSPSRRALWPPQQAPGPCRPQWGPGSHPEGAPHLRNVLPGAVIGVVDAPSGSATGADCGTDAGLGRSAQ